MEEMIVRPRIRLRAYGPHSGPHANEVDGEFVKEYDPNGGEGGGFASFTTDPHEAVTFATMAEAIAFTQQVPRSKPFRDDGKPNRPLTAFSISFEPVTAREEESRTEH